jgi:hypothetical protein
MASSSFLRSSFRNATKQEIAHDAPKTALIEHQGACGTFISRTLFNNQNHNHYHYLYLFLYLSFAHRLSQASPKM